MVQVGFLIRMAIPSVMTVMLSKCHDFDSHEQKSCDTSHSAPHPARARTLAGVPASRNAAYQSVALLAKIDEHDRWRVPRFPGSALAGLPVCAVMENERVVLLIMTPTTVDSHDTFRNVPLKGQKRLLPYLPAPRVAAQRLVVMTVMTPATVDSHDSSLISQEMRLQCTFLVHDSLRHFVDVWLLAESEVLPYGRYEQH
jgi:hypothetical protein